MKKIFPFSHLSYLFLLGLLGCFNPDLMGTDLSCDASHGCPDGYSCTGGKCVSGPGAAGCASQMGTNISNSSNPDRAYACPGTFPAGGAGKLCAAGFSVCKSTAQIDLPTCAASPGFYMADLVTRALPQMGGAYAYQCLEASIVASSGQIPGWAGCGKGLPGIQTPTVPCGGFTQLILKGSGLDIVGTPGFSPIDPHTVNTVATNGVLCCR